MNLSGFCAADPENCAPYAQNIAQVPPAASLAASPGFRAVESALMNIAGFVGQKIVCPVLPGLGAALGGSLAIAETPVTIGGVTVGWAAGEALRHKLCEVG
jgi:hypothetical protein